MTAPSSARVVDARRVRRLLERVTDDVNRLRREEADSSALASDLYRLAAVKYFFITAIEGCIDAAQHCCASEGWGPPESNAAAMRVIGEHDVVDHELAEAMAQAVGFRNVLVHGYAEVDDRRVIDFLGQVGVLGRFVGGVSAWVTRQDVTGVASAEP